MQFRGIDENGNEIPIPVNVKLADGHKAIYAHGAQGAFLGNYHFRIDFYQEIMPPFEYTEVEGKIGQNAVSQGIDRLVVASVYVPIPFLKEMTNWLEGNIAEYEGKFGEIRLLASFQSEDSKG